MKRTILFCIIALFLFSLGQANAQLSRNPQWEVFLGAAVPLSPDGFKDYYKVGGSIHGQYVIFPSPNLGISFGLAAEGFTFDGDAALETLGNAGFDITDATIEGSASVVELGIGLRPYLTPMESPTQFFLFGMATYNSLRSELKVSQFGYSQTFEDKAGNFGLAVGAGLEFPMGERFNFILQGLTRFIFSSYEDVQGEKQTLSFIGITGGLVF